MNELRRWSVVFALLAVPALGAEVADELPPVELRDAKDSAAPIPDLGNKVLAIFYADADVADVNDPLADALKAKAFNDDKYRGMGIANLADSKAPNFLIRKIIQGKIEKYKTTILTDPDHLLPAAWKLGDCNNASVVIVIGKDKKVKHIQRGAIRGGDITKIVALVEKLVNEG